MNAISFWKYFLWGMAAISLCYCGLFVYNYMDMGGSEGWQNNRVPMVAMSAIISITWCCNLFYWIYCALTDTVRKFLLYAIPVYLVLVALSVFASHLLK